MPYYYDMSGCELDQTYPLSVSVSGIKKKVNVQCLSGLWANVLLLPKDYANTFVNKNSFSVYYKAPDDTSGR